MSDWILHHYWPSPFAHKIRLALRLADIAWSSVEIPRVPPKPDLMPLTGGYRRTPVLQQGADIFCDTQNIARALGETDAQPVLFPDSQLEAILSYTAWLDSVVFDAAVRVVLTHALDTAPIEFIADRGSLYFEPTWTPESLRAELPAVIRQLYAHCTAINEQLTHRAGVFSEKPSYADVGVAFLAWFIRGRWEQGADFLDQFPAICETEAALHSGTDRYTELTAEGALECALNANPQQVVGWSPSCFESLSIGDSVRVKPKGQTADPWVEGQLLGMTASRVTIGCKNARVGQIAVHFPMAGYQLLKAL